MNHLFALSLTAAVVLAIASLPAVAQSGAAEYPARAVRIIVPQPAGAGADIVARAIVQKIPESWRQQVIVDNRAGANGIIGVELAARSKPDGYTLLYGYTSALTVNPSVYKALPYDTLRDFAPITQTVSNTIALVVNPHLPARSVSDLVALARARPGELLYGSAGVGNQTHLTAELFLVKSKLKMLHVPYKGSTPALSDLLTGQVALMFTPSAAAAPHIHTGKMRLLATCGETRATAFPDAPTMIESGFPGVISIGWGALLAPAGTPPEIIQKVHKEFSRQLASAELRERLSALGTDAATSSPEELAMFLKSEIGKWNQVVRAANIYQSQ
ncbi:MAG: Bug family tripartite tricarboxylate transporter substrate binding protein [Burkholderiales bacterium]